MVTIVQDAPDSSGDPGRLVADRVVIFGLLLAYRVILEAIYRYVVAPSYGYLGIVVVDVPASAWWATLVLATAPALWLPRVVRQPSDAVSLFLCISVVVPSTFVPLVSGALPLQASLAAAGAISSSHFILSVVPARVRVSVNGTGAAFRARWLPVAVLILLLAPVVAVLGVPSQLPGLAEVYDVRFEYRASLSGTAGRVVAYALPWCGTAMVPLLMVLGLERRRWILVAAAYAVGVYIFSSTGLKSLLAAPILVHGAWLLMRRQALRRTAVALLAVVLALSAATFADSLLGRPIVNGVVTRRALLVPGLLTGYYIAFFSANRPYMLSASVASRLQDKAYPESPPFLIGGNFFNDAQVSANAHFLVDGFAQFRWAGLFGAAGLLAVVLVFANASLVRFRTPAATAVVLPLSFSLTNSALLTVMSTHGLLLLMVVSAFTDSDAADD